MLQIHNDFKRFWICCMFFRSISHLVSKYLSGRFRESCGILPSSLKKVSALVVAAMLAQYSVSFIALFMLVYLYQGMRKNRNFVSCHKSIHTGRKAAAVLTMSFQGDWLKNINKLCLSYQKTPETHLTYCFSPGPVPKQSMAQQIEIEMI